jgi:hypothetical protein
MKRPIKTDYNHEDYRDENIVCRLHHECDGSDYLQKNILCTNVSELFDIKSI